MAGAVSFVASQPDVTAAIGVIGLSMGGEEAIGAAAADGRIHAVVAEGATNRVAGDLDFLANEYGLSRLAPRTNRLAPLLGHRPPHAGEPPDHAAPSGRGGSADALPAHHSRERRRRVGRGTRARRGLALDRRGVGCARHWAHEGVRNPPGGVGVTRDELPRSITPPPVSNGRLSAAAQSVVRCAREPTHRCHDRRRRARAHRTGADLIVPARERRTVTLLDALEAAAGELEAFGCTRCTASRPALPPRRVRRSSAPRLLLPVAGDPALLSRRDDRPRADPLQRDAHDPAPRAPPTRSSSRRRRRPTGTATSASA